MAKMVLEMANQGQRVMGFAELDLDPIQFPPNYEFDTAELNFPTVIPPSKLEFYNNI
jgi:hypothetical protein